MKLYTISTCPKCGILKSKLKAKNISFEEITDENIHREKGFSWFPILEVDNRVMEFSEANTYINSL